MDQKGEIMDKDNFKYQACDINFFLYWCRRMQFYTFKVKKTLYFLPRPSQKSKVKSVNLLILPFLKTKAVSATCWVEGRGICRRYKVFSLPTSAAVASPLLGMDFLTKWGLSIIPSKLQVLHAASGCTISKASTASLITP
jgi:hypothetical protein